jgi:hypothetical protein
MDGFKVLLSVEIYPRGEEYRDLHYVEISSPRLQFLCLKLLLP